MAAKLKKRALAEYSQVVQESAPQPVKKLRLVHKVKPQEPPLSFQGVNTNEDILMILLRFENILPIEADHFDHCQRLLLEQYYNCKDTAVRAKIASICGKLSKSTNVDVSRCVSDLLNLLKNEDSHKVISQILGALMICGCALPLNRKLHQQVVSCAVKHLSINSHLVKCKCLQILGSLASPESDDQPSASSQDTRLHSVLGEFTHDADSRVRTAAFEAMLKWHQRGIRLEQSVFDKASQALKDDYESVRSVATKLIWVTSQLYPDRKVKVSDTEEENYLIDDGFAKICNMLNDSSVRVRAEAAALLGSLHGVSQKFLDQTLDKRLMSNMQRRVTNKDKIKEALSGSHRGFSSGRKWADDAPNEGGEEELSIAVMNMGACGAFVHGLEDEFMEVRNASIDSMCELASRSESFALQCVDSLVDMFNDEIEQIQLNAINSLRKISHVIVLREEQLDVIMGCIKAFSFEVREAFRGLLSCVKFGNRDCIRTCILGLLDLLKKYPQDRADLWQCMTKMGKNNEAFILSLAPELLSSHPYFEAVEPSITDPAYVSVLLLVFNAAVNCPSMTQLFPEHTVNHYKYLRNTLPNLVPELRLLSDSGLLALSSPPRSASPTTFLEQTVSRLGSVENLNSTGAIQLIRMGIRDLERVSELEASLAPNASLMSMYLECHLCLSRILSDQGTSFISQIQSNTGTLLQKVVSLTHQMEQQFLGVAIGDLSHILQLRVLAQSAQLLVLLATNLAGMKQSCIQYLQLLNNFERFLKLHKLEANAFMQVLLQNMQKLESCDPAVYQSVLLQALKDYRPQVLRLSNSVKKTRAEVIEPVVSDKTISFITGLASAVDMIVVIEDMEDTSTLRIQVKYPDQQMHTFVPKPADIRHLSESRHRLITKVLLSHQQWSGPCQVELSVGLAYKKQRDFTEEKSAAKDKNTEEYIQLCKPVKLTVAPKPLKK